MTKLLTLVSEVCIIIAFVCLLLFSRIFSTVFFLFCFLFFSSIRTEVPLKCTFLAVKLTYYESEKGQK